MANKVDSDSKKEFILLLLLLVVVVVVVVVVVKCLKKNQPIFTHYTDMP